MVHRTIFVITVCEVSFCYKLNENERNGTKRQSVCSQCPLNWSMISPKMCRHFTGSAATFQHVLTLPTRCQNLTGCTATKTCCGHVLVRGSLNFWSWTSLPQLAGHWRLKPVIIACIRSSPNVGNFFAVVKLFDVNILPFLPTLD